MSISGSVDGPGPIVLIGPMAAGKSHLAKYMARRFGYGYIDSDQVIAARHGPIPELFVVQGERRFREIEAEAIAGLLADPAHADSIVSLGGGAPMTPSVSALLEKAVVAYLQIDAATVRPRLRSSGNRPMLRGDATARWDQLLAERASTYEALADIRLDARGGRPIARIAADLHREIEILRGR